MHVNISIQGKNMYFCSEFSDIEGNESEKNVHILTLMDCRGRFLGTNITVIPNEELYPNIWWGEGEVKVFIDGDDEYPTLADTGADYQLKLSYRN